MEGRATRLGVGRNKPLALAESLVPRQCKATDGFSAKPWSLRKVILAAVCSGA